MAYFLGKFPLVMTSASTEEMLKEISCKIRYLISAKMLLKKLLYCPVIHYLKNIKEISLNSEY